MSAVGRSQQVWLAARLGMLLLLATLSAYGAWLAPLDRTLHDWLLRGYARAAPSDVILVEIDSASLNRLGEWPWSRGLHAEMIHLLGRAGSRLIGYNLLFADPDLRDPLADEALARAIEEAGNVVLPIGVGNSTAAGPAVETLPHMPFAQAAQGMGHVDAPLDPDGVVRSVYLQAGVGSPVWPLLALKLLQLFEPDSTPVPRGRTRQLPPQLGSIAWERDQRIDIPYLGPPGTVQRIGFAELLNGQTDLTMLRDAVVFVGVTAESFGDRLITPNNRGRLMSGSEWQAQIFASLRDGLAIRPLNPVWSALFALMATLSHALPLMRRRRLWPVTLVLNLLLFGGVIGVFYGAQLWLPFASALLSSLTAALFWIGDSVIEQNRRLRLERVRAQIVLHHVADAVINLDENGRILTLNPAAQDLCGCPDHGCVGMLLRDTIGLVDEEGRHPIDIRFVPGQARQGEGLLINRQGVERFVRWRSRSYIEGDRGIVLSLFDITEQRRLLRTVTFQATHDALTGLPNRSFALEALRQEIARGKRRQTPVAVLFLDVNGLKRVNDQHGHAAGDGYLKSFARRLREAVRGQDVVARLSGDEFVIIAGGLDHAGALKLAERLLAGFDRAPAYLGNLSLPLDASIGIALYPENGVTPDTLLAHADIAMYHAKHGGGARFHFYAPTTAAS